MMKEPNHQPLSRRDFLRIGAAASAGAVGLPGLLEAKGSADDPFGGFEVGVQSFTFRTFDLERTVKATHDLGLHYIEFCKKHVLTTSTPAQVKSVLSLCGDYDVTPNAFGVEKFTSDHDYNKKIFEFAKWLGVKSLSADPDPDSFGSLDKLVEEYGIAIAIHPHGPNRKGVLHRWYSAEVILEAVKDHHPLIGTCLDTGHLLRCARDPFGIDLDPAQQVRLMGARNFGMHLKDYDIPLGRDVIFGQGPLDVREVLAALRKVKFRGSLSIEYEANPEDPIADVRACIEVLKSCVKQLS